MNKSLGTHTLPALGEGQPGAAHLLGLSEEESVRLEIRTPTLSKWRRPSITSWASACRAAATRAVIKERGTQRAFVRCLRVCPGTSSGITKFSEHEAD